MLLKVSRSTAVVANSQDRTTEKAQPAVPAAFRCMPPTGCEIVGPVCTESGPARHREHDPIQGSQACSDLEREPVWRSSPPVHSTSPVLHRNMALEQRSMMDDGTTCSTLPSLLLWVMMGIWESPRLLTAPCEGGDPSLCQICRSSPQKALECF